MGKADLHVHTSASDGMATASQVLDYVENSTDLDVVAITDHDNLGSALAARDIWAKQHYRFEFIVGIEVTAVEGHIIGLYVEDPIPSLRPMEEVISTIHRQGGLAIVAHPMCWITRSLSRTDLDRVHESSRDDVYLDAMEINGQIICGRISQKRARRLNRECYQLPEVGGSDAHFLKAIGSAYTEFQGSSADDLRLSIKNNRCRPVTGRHPGLLEIGLGQVARQSYRGITATPRQMGWGPTAMSFIKRIFPYVK